jgi:hypothetical protein
MSEYIIGDRITTQPYALTESDRNAVGIRVYGPAGKTGMDYMPNDHYFVIFQAVDVSMLLDVGETALTGGEIADVFEGWDNDGYSEITDIVSVSDWIADKSEIVCFNPNEPVDVDFALIFEGGTHMTTVTERIANITIDSTEEVTFKPAYPFYAVKGESVKATLIANIAADATQGVYSTDNGNGYTIIKNPKMETTLYLTGTGDVSVWGGENPEACPFV